MKPVFPFLDAAIGYQPGGVAELLLLFLFVVLVEGVILMLFRYKRMVPCFLDALIVNGTSTALGGLLFSFGLHLRLGEPADLLFLFGISVITEGLILYFLRKDFPVSKMLIAVVAMNLVSYLLFFVFSIALL